MFGRCPVLLFRLGFGCLFLFLSSLSVSWGAGSSSFTLPPAPVLSSADVYGPVEGAPATLPCRFGQLCARRLGDGDTIDYGYDPDSAGGLRGEPTRMWLTGADGEPLAEQSFVYDAAGEMTGRTMRYADGLDRLKGGIYGARGGGSTDGFDPSQNAIGFHGRYEDAETGNLMYPSRLYGGGGRFTTQDAESTPNLYRAYNDDPVGHGDDGGHSLRFYLHKRSLRDGRLFEMTETAIDFLICGATSVRVS